MFGKPTIFFDVDDTLVLWGKEKNPACLNFTLQGISYKLLPHYKHIDLLKKCWKDGYKIVMWSGSGEDWCDEVCRVLELDEFVDVKLTKPKYYVDDLKADQFLFNQMRIYYEQK
jgi:hypothetical protein